MNCLNEPVSPGEEDIVRQAMAGDIDAFEMIYRKYSGMVYGIALRMTNSVEDSEEIVQDVFVSAHRSLKNFREGSSLKTWLYRISVNTSLNALRRTRSIRGRELPMAEGADFEDRRNLQAEAEESEAIEKKVKDLLALLNPDQRACLVLRAKEGLSYDEIARVLNVNINTVRTRLKRARAMIQKHVPAS
ncbi:MAG: sigma-70 family RNA polymerase sigma factor [Candidatus Omnitrophica bacterium]|nr:sigma-70 family RNA polymerase sigma factor [Candidatus Omnitrophota bacterium]